jgi:SAM-dependent methyltransferase
MPADAAADAADARADAPADARADAPAYAKLARFYDEIMGDRSTDIMRVRNSITRYQPTASTLLELGSGTGAVLAGLAGSDPGLAVTGVDRSAEMLAVAATKVPAARLVHADMTEFSLDTRFDVVICVFDTLNHLARFESWRRMFKRVHDHLADDGLFVFDVNTIGRLRGLWRGPAFASDFGENAMIMDVWPAATDHRGIGELSMWTVRIFERVEGEMFRLHAEHIPELAVPLAAIREALAPNFEVLDASGLSGEPATDESARAFFACRRRSVNLPPQRRESA